MATPIFICGAECGIAITGAAKPSIRHWTTSNNNPAIDTVITKDSAKSFKFVSSAGTCFLTTDVVNTNTRIIGRMYLYFETLPSVDTTIVDHTTTGAFPRIRFASATSKLQAQVSTTVDGPVVVTGQWYRVEWSINVGSNPRTLDWQVDGVAQTSISDAVTASTVTNMKFGMSNGIPTGTLYIDNIELSATIADYPMGAGKVVGYKPNVDGTHSFTAGDFKYNHSTAVLLAATDINTYLDDTVITDTSDYISQEVINAASYVEFGLADTAETVDARGIAITLAQNDATGVVNGTVAAKLEDGASELVLTNESVATSNLNYRYCVVAAPPSGGTWTPAKINALKIRWGYGTVTSDFPSLHGVVMEVSYPATITTIYPLTSIASGSTYGDTQVNGSAPATATTTTGWTVATTASGNFSRMAFGVERLASTFSTTAQPSGAPDNTLGDCYRVGPLTGAFEAGIWDFSFALRAVTNANGQDGRVRVRVWKSVNADGSAAVEITSGASTFSTVTDLTTTVDQNSTGTISLPTIVLSSSYLFVQVAWEITGAAS